MERGSLTRLVLAVIAGMQRDVPIADTGDAGEDLTRLVTMIGIGLKQLRPSLVAALASAAADPELGSPVHELFDARRRSRATRSPRRTAERWSTPRCARSPRPTRESGNSARCHGRSWPSSATIRVRVDVRRGGDHADFVPGTPGGVPSWVR